MHPSMQPEVGNGDGSFSWFVGIEVVVRLAGLAAKKCECVGCQLNAVDDPGTTVSENDIGGLPRVSRPSLIWRIRGLTPSQTHR